MSNSPQRTVLVTGCSSGIGAATATMLRTRGYRVFASARAASDVERLAAEGFESLQLDVADDQSIAQACEQLLIACEGNLYGLVNNAGFGVPGAVEDLGRAALREQFETNVFGAQVLANRLLPAMRAAGSGRIVHVSSVLGLVAMAWRGAYNASKFALEALADTQRIELAGSGIFVVLVEPGPIRSRFRINAYDKFKRWIKADDSVHAATYAVLGKRFESDSDAPFTLPADAVANKILRALEARKPSARYFVTAPTYLLATLRRLLPGSALDALMVRMDRGERRRAGSE